MFEKSFTRKSDKFYLIYLLLFVFSLSLGVLFVRYNYIQKLKHHLESAINHTPEYIKYVTLEAPVADTNSFQLSGKFKNTLAISRERSNYFYSIDYLIFGRPWIGSHEWHKLKLKSDQNKANNVKVKLFGLNADHWAHPYLISYRIKTKQVWKGLSVNSKFNLVRPKSRLYYTDALINKSLSKSHPVTIPYNLLSLKVPRDNRNHLYMQEGFFTKELIEQNRQRESIIFSLKDVNHSPFDTAKTNTIVNYFRYQLISNPESVFDRNVLNQLILLRVLTNYHGFGADNLHFYLNPLNEKLYPIYRELRFQIPPHIYDSLLNDETFLETIKTHLPIDSWYTKYFFDEITSNDVFKDELFEDFVDLITKMKETYFSENFQEFARQIKADDPGSLHLLNELEHILQSDTPQIGRHYEIEDFETILINSMTLNQDSIIHRKHINFGKNPNINLNGHKLKIENCTFKNELNSGQIYSTLIGGSLFFNNCGKLSMKETRVGGLSPYSGQFIDLPSCLTFYKTDMNASHCLFENNLLGDDLVNVFDCNSVVFRDCEFNFSHADALDSDFSSISLTNCSFKSIGNDAVDGSGTDADINDCYFENVEDKAISAGENSIFHLSSNVLNKCALGLVVKDGSSLYEKNTRVDKCDLAFIAFNKKWQYGPPTAYIHTNILLADEARYLVQNGSKIKSENNSIVKITANNVEDLLYGNVYGKSSR